MGLELVDAAPGDGRRCQFGICAREAEMEISVRPDVVPVLVCGLHVTPVLTWGVAEPATDPVLRILYRPESAA